MWLFSESRQRRPGSQTDKPSPALDHRLNRVAEVVPGEHHSRRRVVQVEAVRDDRHGEPDEENASERAADSDHSSM